MSAWPASALSELRIRVSDVAEVAKTFGDMRGRPKLLASSATLRLSSDEALVEILDYIASGNKLEPLYAGKLAGDHIPIIRGLLLRGVLRPPPLRPRYLDYPQAAERLERLRQGMTVVDLL